jgi:hypothetical protein
MTAPAGNPVAVAQSALPIESVPAREPGIVPSSGNDSSQPAGFGLLLASLVSDESGRSGELEGAELRPALEEELRADEGSDGVVEREVDPELTEAPGEIEDESSASLSEAANVAAEIASEPLGELGQPASRESGANGDRPEANPLRLGGEPITPRPETGAQVGLREEPSVAFAAPVAAEQDEEGAGADNRNVTRALPFRASDVGSARASEPAAPLRAPEADAERSAPESPRVEPIAPQSDRGESSASDLGRHAPASPQAVAGETAVEPTTAPVEGTGRGESAPGQGSTRALPELPASNESEIVRGARVLAREGGGTARIQLFPPELGGLEIRVAVTNRGVALRFVADRAAVAELLNHHLPELRHALQLPGLAVERVEIAHREPGLSRGDRDVGHDGSFEGPDDRGEAREDSTRDGTDSPLAEHWASPWEFPAARAAEGRALRSLGTVDLRA